MRRAHSPSALLANSRQPILAAAVLAQTSAGPSNASGTRLQREFLNMAVAIDRIEGLPPRERAVGLDLARRRLARAQRRHAALLAEFDLEVAA